MTMQSDPAVTAGPTPVWVWLLVLVLGALAVFGGYAAATKNQLYWESESAREALTNEKSRLAANVSDLKQQLDQANGAKDKSAAALAQSRADTETASAQISDLQGQVGDLKGKLSDLQTKANDLESKVAAAEEFCQDGDSRQGRVIARPNSDAKEARRGLSRSVARPTAKPEPADALRANALSRRRAAGSTPPPRATCSST